MMDNRELAGKLRDLLPEERWWHGDGDLDDRLCLGLALDTFWMNQELYGNAYQVILAITDQLFPGRSSSWNSTPRCIAAFNDHPDTTYEDILLVLKYLEET